MEALVNLLLSIWDRLLLWENLQPNEGGVRVRTVPRWFMPRGGLLARWWPRWAAAPGQWITELGPGSTWKLPGVDRITKIVVKRRTIDIPNITAETAGDETYIVSLTLTYAVTNVRRALLECEDFDVSLIVDSQALVTGWVNQQLPGAVTAQALQEANFPAIRRAGFRWGCEIESVGVNSIAKHTVYRLLME